MRSPNPLPSRLRFAACAPFLPRAVFTRLGSLLIVPFFLAALAAFLTFFRAAAFCFEEAMRASSFSR